MVPVIAAGAALFAGGVAVSRVLGGGAVKIKASNARPIPESEVPAHIREKVLRKKRGQ